MDLPKTWSTSLQISLYLLTLITVSQSQSEPSFISQPIERTVLEGDDVTFYCIIDNLLPSHDVSWYRGGIRISTGVTVDPSLTQVVDRFSIEGNEDQGEYNLKITEVALADDIDYYCKVTASSGFNLESDHARLEVHHVPPNKYPGCFPLSKESFVAGETITLTCQSERGNPPVMLKWLRKEQHLSAHLDDSQNGYRSLDYEFTIGPENHGDIFQCKMESSAANTYIRRSCSLGPLNVLFPPAKPILETTPKIIAADQEIELSCKTDANPTPLYTWSFSNNFDQRRITYTENGQSILFTTELSDNGTAITCNATNEYGTNQSKTLLNFNPTQTKPVYGTTPSQTLKPNDDNSDQPHKPQTDTSNNVVLKPEILAIVASTLTLILLVLIILIVITCRCRPQNPKTVNQMPQMIYGQYGPTSVQGWEQGSIYFEPRDRISVRDMPTWQRPTPWHRNVAVQVPWVEEPPYEEIGQNWDEGMTLEI